MADETWNIAQTAYVSAINAEIQGMMAANQDCLSRLETPVHEEAEFQQKAQELYGIYDECMKSR